MPLDYFIKILDCFLSYYFKKRNSIAKLAIISIPGFIKDFSHFININYFINFIEINYFPYFQK